ncbi:MAG TPA: A24 family peptidase [Terriglobales bacterium]|nr:A24 family peptidase [Terriglobales bacterium]
MSEWLWQAFVIAFVVTCAIGDARWRKIPRAFTTCGVVAGLAFHLWSGGLASAAAAAFLGFAVGLAFFQLGAIGGGDVKLMAALGALLGLQPWLVAMQIAVFVAALMAVAQIFRRGAWRQTLENMREILRALKAQGLRAHPVLHVKNAAMIRAPFGVAAACGTLFALVAR